MVENVTLSSIYAEVGRVLTEIDRVRKNDLHQLKNSLGQTKSILLTFTVLIFILVLIICGINIYMLVKMLK